MLLSDGSTRMSERFSFSSTKNGPSVSSGRTMHDGTATAAVVLAEAEAAAVAVASVAEGLPVTLAVALAIGESSLQAARNAAPREADPRRISASRRDRIRPTGASSLSMGFFVLHGFERLARPIVHRVL